mgnify:CR=1 FL=1
MHMHAPHVAHTQKLRIDLDTCGSFASIRIVLEYTKFRTLFRTLNAKETLNLDYNLDRHTKFSRYGPARKPCQDASIIHGMCRDRSATCVCDHAYGCNTLYCLRVGPILKYSTKFKKIAVKAE